jgi:hypothetical protein
VTISEELAALAATARASCGSTALAWALVLDGLLAMSGGIGSTDRTVYRIASMTESFTAAAAEPLATHGSLAVQRVEAVSHTEGTVVVGGGADAPARIAIMRTPLASWCIERDTIRR